MKKTTIRTIATAIMTIASMLIASTVAVSANATEAFPTLAEELYSYYDLNCDGMVTISDLASANKLLTTGELGEIDVYFIREYVLTEQWPDKLTYFEIAVDDMAYDEENINLVNNICKGHVVDIQKYFPDDYSGTVRVRLLRNAQVSELRCSTMDAVTAHPVLWAFNREDEHIGISVNDEGQILWDHYAYPIETDADEKAWLRELHEYYDFDNDGKITVFDLVIAKKLAFEGDKLSYNDVVGVEEYLLKGIWENGMMLYKAQCGDYKFSRSNLDWLNCATCGLLVDWKITGDCIKMRFLNDLTVYELTFEKKGDVVLPIKQCEEANVIIGFREDGSIAWDVI